MIKIAAQGRPGSETARRENVREVQGDRVGRREARAVGFGSAATRALRLCRCSRPSVHPRSAQNLCTRPAKRPPPRLNAGAYIFAPRIVMQ